ncbi:class I SAM-dependent methyltransferase [Nocardia wallacei]|uniref:class I SAM-dependent methyltransferase n=1 Tax=Nocardia wallacei TaxID=480035 RepID=UPI0024544F97|nr:class I SAM-dependent methyltransferase [Nocardia wallacei]
MAESFGVDAERYDRTRPPYPPDLVARIIAATPSPGARGVPGLDVLDVGCGTGIEARQFRAAGCRVLGVEPDGRMAEFARRSGVAVEVATFEEWDPAGRDFDLVVAGTAWHWVDPVAGAVQAARVLRPGGRLAVFWHVFQTPPEVTDATIAAFTRAVPDSPIDMRVMRQSMGADRTMADAYQPMFDKASEGIRAAGEFGTPEQWRFDWERSYTRDEWLDQMPTHGALTRLRPDQLADVLGAVGDAIDTLGGSFTMPYATIAVTAVRGGA